MPSKLWHNRDFKLVFIGQGISNLGDSISVTALPLLILSLTGSGTLMGVAGALERIPSLIFGLLAGALADRLDRGRAMYYCDLGRALLTGLIPLSVILGIPTMPVVLIVAAPIGFLGVLFRAAYTAAIPKLVEREQIGRANAYFEALESLAWVVGPAIAGLLFVLIGPGLTVALDAASFFISAMAIRMVRRPLQDYETRAEMRPILHEITDGVAFIYRHTILRTAILFWAAGRLLVVPLIPAITFLIINDRSWPSYIVGYAVSAYAVGSSAGTLMASRISEARAGQTMLAGSAATGIGILVIILPAGILPILIGPLAFGMAEGLMLVAYLNLRAVHTPNEMLGRVGAAADTAVLGLSPLGAFAGGLLLDIMGGDITLVLMGSLILVVTLIFTAVSRLRYVIDN